MIPPKEIAIKSDNNTLTYKDIMKPKDSSKELLYVYEYTKSKTKKGSLLWLTEAQLEKLISTNQ